MFFTKPLLYKVVGLCMLIASLSFGFDKSDIDIDFFGSAMIQAGQYKHFKYRLQGYELANKWMQDNILTLGLRTRINDRLSGDVSLKAWLFFNPFPDSLMNNPQQDMNAPTVDFYMMSARMKLHLSPYPEDSLFNLEIGLFPFKYNPNARNLGEYMFRTGCYPGYIYSEGFDLAGAPLSGIHLENNLFNGVMRNDLFFTSEVQFYPSKDFSLTFLTDVTPVPNGVINFGAGLQLFRLLSVDDAYTTPTQYEYMSFAGDQKIAPNWYITDGDTAYYTFAGTKIMGRLAFDPKPLFGSPEFFGPEDLKIYSEAIILGVKNYPASLDSSSPISNYKPINEFGYDNLIEKMPIMFGFNWPTHPLLSYTIAPALITFGVQDKGKIDFSDIVNKSTLIATGTGLASGFGLWFLEKKLDVSTGLDVLSLELEYYGKKYVNRVPIYANSKNILRLPIPYDPFVNSGHPNGSLEGNPNASGNYTKDTYKTRQAQWKWSVYAKKTLFERFYIATQFARDHTLIKTGLAQNVDYEEIFVRGKQWYWMMKFGYFF